MSHEYFTRPGKNWSSIKLMDESALAYKYGLDHPRPDTAALALGRVVHSLVFEPETIATDYAIFTGPARRGKEWDAFAAEHAGKTIFKTEELSEAREMAAAVRVHPLVKPYLTGGEFERVVTWTDPATKLGCKAKMDWIIPSRRILIDLKTTKAIHPRRFAADVARYHYHGQLGGHYSNACTYGLEWTPERVIIIAVEKSAPYDVAVYELDDAGKECGQELAATLLERVKWCEERNFWPGAQFDWEARTLSEGKLELPGWLYGAGDIEVTYEQE